MFLHHRTQGLIIKKIERGEADRLFTIYTKDFGKLEILAKAIRKIKSKLKGGAKIFYLSEIEFIQGKTHKTLTDAILINDFPNLRRDLKILSIAFRISEVLDNLVKGEEPDQKIWDLLQETFTRLNGWKLKTENWKLIYYYFLWNLLSILGYQPELYNCSLCQKKLIPEKLYFFPKDGGIICELCFKKNKVGQKQTDRLVCRSEISPEAVKVLRIILEKDWEILSKLKIEPSHQKALKNISENYLAFVLEGSK